jgi:hypothetical protein
VLALAVLGGCAKDKTTTLNLKLVVAGALDQVRIDEVRVGAEALSQTGKQTLFPASPRTLQTDDVIAFWFDDGDDMKSVIVSATGLLCGKDATARVMTAAAILAKQQTVTVTLTLTSNGASCTGDGGSAGAGGASGSGGGGAGGTAGSAAGGAGGAGGSGGSVGGAGGVAGSVGGAGRGGIGGTGGGVAGRGGTTGTAGTGGGAAGRGGTSGTGGGAAGRGGTTGTGATGGAAGRGGTTGTAGTGGAAGRGGSGGGGGVAGCNPGPSACTDCLDNDVDGLVDAQDDDCTGAIDNDEGSFSNAIPGDNLDPCVKDCYFDGNSGAGDDDCRWKLQCDSTSPGAPTCPYDPLQVGSASCPTSQSATCLTQCTPRMPNGCDCFGCCQIPGGSGNAVLIANVGCSMQGLTDPLKCPPCSIRSDCFNACDTCDLCIGKHTLPTNCSGVQSCPAGHARCGLAGQPPCQAGSFCLTGCCT